MVRTCCLKSFTSISTKEKLSFFSIPCVITNQGENIKELSLKRRHLWLKKLSLGPDSISKHSRVCAKHFLSGAPSQLYDETNPDLILGALLKLCLQHAYRLIVPYKMSYNFSNRPIKSYIFKISNIPLDVVEADLLKDEGWDEAVKDCAFVLHAAGPFPNKPMTEDQTEIIAAMVDGTRRVLEACSREAAKGHLKRVVCTSGMAAVHGEYTSTEGKIYNENDWTDENSPTTETFYKYGTIKEKIAWEFVKNLSPDNKFELAVINGGYAMGATLSKAMSSGKEVIYRLMDRRRLPLLPEVHLAICDVRDMAEAHVRAMTVPEAAGHRHLVVSDHLWFKEIATILNDEFGKQGYNIPMHYAPYPVLWVASLFDETVKYVMNRYYKTYFYDSSRVKNVLGVELRPSKRTILDTAHSMIKYETIKRTNKYIEPDYDFQS